VESDNKKIVITGIDIPFIDLVILLVKLALASIPAMVIIFTILGVLSMLFNGMFMLRI